MMGTRTERQYHGEKAEQAACTFLTARGLRLLDQNYRCKHGEIDLIMQDRDSIVFIEVRFRSNPCFGSGADTVDRRKQTKLLATAQHYLQQHPQAARHACRFDVISIHQEPVIENIDWIADAFQVS